MLGKGSTGGCAGRIRSRMSAVVHVKRPSIFALLHLAGNRRVLANVVSPGGETVICFYVCHSLRSIGPRPPKKPRGLGSRGAGSGRRFEKPPFAFTAVLNAGGSSNPTEFRTAVNTFEGIY